ncbi:glycosyltransferase involved in cell wall biosynthesis [Chitinophaga polysaccharea]|uniref:Glycosyltransferase involved in cell wall biosynthesis n=1 Tax=Chitinophaga polysaccharea TaxID=1293035 RepID=A0A561Q4G8_9BACT|nr:glycosyltransferase [Chitinophaga polysaccharea]TWF45271.1 glycosyltransferase involved in cell wall biosynthesis [Chitinophaga polysaccharea]
MKSIRRIAIITSCEDDWGGCEELWCRSIPYLQQAGYTLSVIRKKLNRQHPEFIRLAKTGVTLFDLCTFSKEDKVHKAAKLLYKIYGKLFGVEYILSPPYRFKKWLKNNTPTLVIVSQSINFDGLRYASVCHELGIHYVIVSHKAVDFYWPAQSDRKYMIRVFRDALHCFFVSKHNLLLTEEQFGIRFNNASVIFNPLRVERLVPYPQVVNEFRLACVGRLFLLDKGQDILIRIMASPLWKNRNLKISFIGKGIDEEGLKEMAALLNVDKVEFKGQITDFSKICEEHHAFILPSRSEGMPLVIVEAMAAGRMVIASKAGGNGEMIEEGVTGYLGLASEPDFEAAMERAWNNRHRWHLMGLAASQRIAHRIPLSPESVFAKKIISLTDRQVFSSI